MAKLVLWFFLFSFVLFHVFFSVVGSSSTVKFLPGFSGPLPFLLETGYVGVGDSEDVQIFYYFVKSEGNPQKDPLILWHTGGPGCSGLSGLAFEIGPLNFKEEQYNGSVPQLILNPYSWTKKSSIIFLDLPVGTGFSYGKTPEALTTGDFSQVHHSHQFLRKWLANHPEFISNPLFVGGDSYAGLIVPVVAHEILQGNKYISPFVNFQGYILGNPVTIRNSNKNFEIPFAHTMTLISDELFESLTTSCKGEYFNIDPTNAECLRHYDTYKKSVSEIFSGNILLPNCPGDSAWQPHHRTDRRYLYNTPKVLHDLKPPLPTLGCPTYKYILCYYWTNDVRVRKALRIREESIGEWIRCKHGEDYKYDINSSFPYHVNLSSKGYRSLVYSGDHDMVVSHLDTQAWIRSLNYSIVHDWRPWFVIKDQVGGYTRTYANRMTFATIKGGGHTAEYTQKECSIVFSRWIAKTSL